MKLMSRHVIETEIRKPSLFLSNWPWYHMVNSEVSLIQMNDIPNKNTERLFYGIKW